MRRLSVFIVLLLLMNAAAYSQTATPVHRVPALITAASALEILRDGLSLPAGSRVAPGDRVRYETRVANVGGEEARGVHLVSALPNGFDYIVGTTSAEWLGATATNDPIRASERELRFDLDATLPAGGDLILSFDALLTPNVDEVGPYVCTMTAGGVDGNRAYISADAAVAAAADVVLLPARPALVTTKAVAHVVRDGEAISTAGPIAPGDVVTYRLMVKNVGRGTAYNVGLKDELPPSLSYVAGSTIASWLADVTSVDPVAGPGPSLAWRSSAVLGFGDALWLEFDALVGSVLQGVTYVNAMTASSSDADGTPTSPDRSSEAPGDTDEDDASAVSLPGAVPALSVNKEIVGVHRDGVRLDSILSAVPRDVVTYRVTIRNVGNGTAYNVDFFDRLPLGFTYEVSAPYGEGSYEVSSPSTTGSLGMVGGKSSITTSMDATIDGGEQLVATYAVRVTDAAQAGVSLENVAEAEGFNGAGVEISDANPVVGDIGDDDVEDSDADDTGIASIYVGTPTRSVPPEVLTATGRPALVTEMRVAHIVRDGRTGAGNEVLPNDRVTLEVAVRNVGTGPAYGVAVIGALPPELELVGGSSTARWPLGTSSSDPRGSFGPELEWNLAATLRAGEEIRLSFEAAVVRHAVAGSALACWMGAYGHDAASARIPTNLSPDVPGDVDPDDFSDLILTVRALPCGGTAGQRAEPLGVDLWFETAPALFAAAELEGLGEFAAHSDVACGLDLPAELRAVAVGAQRVGFENLVEVAVGSGMGVPLCAGPRFRDAADPGLTLEQRLDECARAVDLDQRPSEERWIVLEFAGGDPRFSARGSTVNDWPTGEWNAYDRRVTPSAVGMGLMAQVLEAQRLLESDLPRDRYLGCVLVEVMRNKIASLAELRAAPGSSNGLLAHAYTAAWNGPRVVYTVVEPRTDLYDQISLAWGLATFVEWTEHASVTWPAALGSLDGDERVARKELDRILAGVSENLRGSDGALRESTTARKGTPVRTTTLGLLLAALREVSKVTDHPAVERLAAHAAIQLSGRVGLDGRVASGTSGWAATDGWAAVRGLLAASRILGVPAYEAAAVRVVTALDRTLWNPQIGAYVGNFHATEFAVCLTPLDLGCVVGALRDLAPILPPAEAERVLVRLFSHVRTILDSAALHLGHALPVGIPGNDDGCLAAVQVSDAPLGWAFVFTDRLCYPKDRILGPVAGKSGTD